MSTWQERLRPWWNWRKARFWLLVLLVAYTLFGFFAAPRLVENTLSDTFAEAGRSFTVERIEVNPFTMTLRAAGARLDDTDGATLLSFDETFINFQATSLFRWAWTFKELRFAGYAGLEERFAEGGTRWMRLIDDLAPAPEEAEPAPAEPQGLPRLIVESLEVSAAALTVIDRQVNDYEGHFGPIDLSVADLRTMPDHRGEQQFVLRTPEGGVLRWSGDIQVVPFASSGRLSIEGRALVNTLRYANHLVPFDVDTGPTDISLDYAVAGDADGLDLAVENLQVALSEISVVRDGQSSPWITLQGLGVAGGSFRWPEGAVALDKVTLDGPDVEAWLDAEGNLNLLELVPASDAVEEPGAEPLSLEVAELVIENGSLRAEDRAVEPPGRVALGGLTVRVTGIDLEDGTRMPVRLDSAFEDGGRIAFEGEVAAFPDVDTTGALTLDGLALIHAQPYLEQFLKAEIESGTLSLAGRVTYGPDQPGRYTGRVAVEGFDLSDAVRGERVTGWQAMRIDEVDADLAANAVTTTTVAFTEPFARLHIAEDRTTNVGDLLVESEGATDQGTMESTPLAITIGGVGVEDGALDFSDFSLPLQFLAQVRDLDGEVSTLSTTSAEAATMTFEGQVNEFGEARIEGTLNAFDITDQADITVAFTNLDMSRLTPYTVSFAGYAIEDGRLDTDLRYVLAQRQLEGENSILVRQLALGEKSEHPEAGSLPLKLAVALLTDTKGEIEIDLPVSGNLDDPEFRIGGVIMRALGNLITKAVTAPFRLLGSLVGVESEDFGRVGFRPGEAEVSPPDREKLVKLADAMRQRPELVLKVSGVVAETADGAALRMRALDQALEERLGVPPSDASLERRVEALETMAAEQAPELDLEALRVTHTTLPPAAADGEGGEAAPEPSFDALAFITALRDQLIERTRVPAGALDALASTRAEAIIAALNAQSPDSPLELTRGDVLSVEADEQGLVSLELEVTAD